MHRQPFERARQDRRRIGSACMFGDRRRLFPLVAATVQVKVVSPNDFLTVQADLRAERIRLDGDLVVVALAALPLLLIEIRSTGPCLKTLRAKSSTKQFLLPSALRVPRPTICTYRPVDNVGRNITSMSMCGTLKPVVNTWTLTTALISPARNAAMIRSRSSCGVIPSTVSQLIPAPLTHLAHGSRA